MSLFNELFAIAGGVVDAVYGEEFQVLPRRTGSGSDTDVNGRTSTDLTRQPFTFVGNFVSDSGEFHAEGRRMSANATRASNAPSPMIDADKTGWPELPRRGDLIKRVATGEVFVLASELPPDDVGRTTLHLAERQARASG